MSTAGEPAPPSSPAMTVATLVTSWIIQVPTGDPEMPMISLGPWFKTEGQARQALRGWREELQEVAQISQHTWEDDGFSL